MHGECRTQVECGSTGLSTKVHSVHERDIACEKKVSINLLTTNVKKMLMSKEHL